MFSCPTEMKTPCPILLRSHLTTNKKSKENWNKVIIDRLYDFAGDSNKKKIDEIIRLINNTLRKAIFFSKDNNVRTKGSNLIYYFLYESFFRNKTCSEIDPWQTCYIRMESTQFFGAFEQRCIFVCLDYFRLSYLLIKETIF